ncbi:MAG: Bug family tripartite tricarboxylate transporter substrate binding protein [Betaproteobacteria bacterium]
MNRRRVLIWASVAAAFAMASPGAHAQAKYPAQPVRVVVPFAPGGVVDTIARLWVQQVEPSLGRIIIDNRGGAGGTIGAAEVARAKADGYTILFGNTSTQVLNPALMKPAPYDAARDFVAIDIIAISATSVIVHPSVPARNLKQLIQYAKANPGKLSYGSAGAGTLTHLAGELLKQRTGGLNIVHVPYKGAGPGIADLISGYVPMMTPNITSRLLSLHREGRVRILSVNAAEPLKGAPDLPLSKDAVPGMIAQLFTGLFAPAGTPESIVNQLSQVTRKVQSNKKFQEALINSGFEPVLESGPSAAQRLVNEERERFLPILKSLDL